MNSDIFVVIDFEANCWNYKRKRKHINEIIEIGAVILKKEDDNFIRLGEFTQTVKPLEDTILSKFCRKLTGITQKEVDQSKKFPIVFENFKNKIEEISGVKCNEITLVTWGNGDKKMLNRNCNLNKTTSPFTRYLNIDKWFARFYGLEQSCTLRKALEMIGLEFVGEQHRALNDALNTSIILEKMGVNLLPENNFKKISARQIQK